MRGRSNEVPPPQKKPSSEGRSLKDAPPVQKIEAHSASFTAVSYSGAHEHPELLREWEAVVPGSAQLILNQSIDQGHHRMTLERKVVDGNEFRANAALFVGAFLAAMVLGAGVWLVYMDHDWAGAGIITGTFGTILGTFAVGKYQNAKELREKRRGMAELMKREGAQRQQDGQSTGFDQPIPKELNHETKAHDSAAESSSGG